MEPRIPRPSTSPSPPFQVGNQLAAQETWSHGTLEPYPLSLVRAIQSLPKVELHQHLGGSIPPEVTWRMLVDRQLQPVASLEDLVRVLVLQPGEEGSLAAYFRKFQYTQWATQLPDCLQEAAFLVARQAWEYGVRLLELRYSPQLHLYGGMSLEQAIAAVLNGLERAATELPGLRVGLIVAAIRNLGPHVAEQLAHQAVGWDPKARVRIVGFDLAGSEVGYPPRLFQKAFAFARAGGLGLTAHVGEETGPEAVWEAIDTLGTHRIGHGCAAVGDPALVRRLARDSILVECCLTSNYQTGAVPRDVPHPIFRFLDAGVPVAVCTDNTTVSSTHQVLENCTLSQRLSIDEIARLHEQAAAHSFLARAHPPEAPL